LGALNKKESWKKKAEAIFLPNDLPVLLKWLITSQRFLPYLGFVGTTQKLLFTWEGVGHSYLLWALLELTRNEVPIHW